MIFITGNNLRIAMIKSAYIFLTAAIIFLLPAYNYFPILMPLVYLLALIGFVLFAVGLIMLGIKNIKTEINKSSKD